MHKASLLILTAALTGCGSSDDPAGSQAVAGAGGMAAGGASGAAGLAGASGAGGVGIAGGAGSGGSAGSGTSSGEPIVAPSKTWSWVPIAGARCADGSATGIGVNLSPASQMVLVYLKGGGACYDEISCYDKEQASHLDGYTESDLGVQATGLLDRGPFDRSDPDNPFWDASYVFVPYCTGDLHAGSAVQVYGGETTHHVGYENLTLILPRLVATFPDAKRVVLSGASAGGMGATFNFVRVRKAFAGTRVDLIDDAGPLFPSPYLPESLEQTLRSAWNLAATLPADCAACPTSLDALHSFGAEQSPESRLGLMTFSADPVIQGTLGLSAGEFGAGLDQLQQSFTPHTNLHYLEVAGNYHVLMGLQWDTTSQNGISVRDWVTALVSDAPNWNDVEPQ